jgi:HAMP domain-containing protein
MKWAGGSVFREVLNQSGLIDQILARRSRSDRANAFRTRGPGQQLEHLGEQLIHIAWIPIQVGTRKARTYSTVFAIQAALIGAVLAFYLSQLLVKPIQQLVQGTKKVSEGDFSQRVVLRSRDEIGELAQSFNRMVVSLEQSQTRLNQSSQELRGTKETLENIIQSSVDAIVATDPKGRITFANRSMHEIILGEAGAEGNLPGSRCPSSTPGLPGSQENHEHHPRPGRLVNYETTISGMAGSCRFSPRLLLKDEKGAAVGTWGDQRPDGKKKLERS